MLYKYKNDYEKIAMGLLSFIPDLKKSRILNPVLNGIVLKMTDTFIYGKMKMVILLQLPALKSMMLRNC